MHHDPAFTLVLLSVLWHSQVGLVSSFFFCEQPVAAIFGYPPSQSGGRSAFTVRSERKCLMDFPY